MVTRARGSCVPRLPPKGAGPQRPFWSGLGEKEKKRRKYMLEAKGLTMNAKPAVRVHVNPGPWHRVGDTSLWSPGACIFRTLVCVVPTGAPQWPGKRRNLFSLTVSGGSVHIGRAAETSWWKALARHRCSVHGGHRAVPGWLPDLSTPTQKYALLLSLAAPRPVKLTRWCSASTRSRWTINQGSSTSLGSH